MCPRMDFLDLQWLYCAWKAGLMAGRKCFAMRTNIAAKFKLWKRTSVYSTLTHSILPIIGKALWTTIVFTMQRRLVYTLVSLNRVRSSMYCSRRERFLSPSDSWKTSSGRYNEFAPSRNSGYPSSFSPRSLLKKSSCHRYCSYYWLSLYVKRLFSYCCVENVRLCIQFRLCLLFKVVHELFGRTFFYTSICIHLLIFPRTREVDNR